MAGRTLIELAGFLPAITLYLSLGLVPDYYSHDELGWLLGMQFLLCELPAAALAIVIGNGLVRGTTSPHVGRGWGVEPPPRPVTPRERDQALLGAMFAFVVVLPLWIGWVYDSAPRAFGVLAAFAPRLLDAWRFRADPRAARALALSGWLSFAFCGVVIGVPMLLSLGGPVAIAIDGARTWAGVLVAYYVVLALGTVALYRRAGV